MRDRTTEGDLHRMKQELHDLFLSMNITRSFLITWFDGLNVDVKVVADVIVSGERRRVSANGDQWVRFSTLEYQGAGRKVAVFKGRIAELVRQVDELLVELEGEA